MWTFSGKGGGAKSKPSEELFQPKFGNFLRKGGGGKAKSKPYKELFHLRFGHFTRGGVKAVQQKSKVELLFFPRGFPLLSCPVS